MFVCGVIGTVSFAQQPAVDRPLSAIDWLEAAPDSGAALAPVFVEPDVSEDATVADVSVIPLGAAEPDRIGLIPADVLGFDDLFWNGADIGRIRTALDKLPERPLPSMADLLHQVLMAQVPSPGDITELRLRGLLNNGAVEAAWAIGRTQADQSSGVFAAARDAAILTENERQLCALWDQNRKLDTSPMTRVLCLAILNQWPAAVMTFYAHDALGDLTPYDRNLMRAHLDPELADGGADPNVPYTAMTPLRFFLLESVGYPKPTKSLPLAYAIADLRNTTGWKTRIEAAERLMQAGSLTANHLLGIYTERDAAASGGVWDRVDAVQNLRRAIAENSVTSKQIEDVWRTMDAVGLAPAAALQFANDLHEIDSVSANDPNLIRLAFLAGLGDIRQTKAGTDISLRLWRQNIEIGTAPTRVAIAKGLATSIGTATPKAEDLVTVLTLAADAQEGDLAALTRALATLRSVGMDQIADSLAIEYLILVDKGL